MLWLCTHTHTKVCRAYLFLCACVVLLIFNYNLRITLFISFANSFKHTHIHAHPSCFPGHSALTCINKISKPHAIYSNVEEKGNQIRIDSRIRNENNGIKSKVNVIEAVKSLISTKLKCWMLPSVHSMLVNNQWPMTCFAFPSNWNELIHGFRSI